MMMVVVVMMKLMMITMMLIMIMLKLLILWDYSTDQAGVKALPSMPVLLQVSR